MSKPVGFDQKVLLKHLDFTASQTKKYERKEMYNLLDGYLREDITGAKSRKNAITMLMKIWYLVDEDLIPIRDEILNHFHKFSHEERLIVHWGFVISAYPFFKDVANEFGRLFQLQDNVSSIAIGKRMKESYGDRRRVEVATSAVLMSMKVWKVIIPTEKRFYSKNEKIHVMDPLLQTFLIQILLKVSNQNSISVDIMYNHPLYFPFTYDIDIQALRDKKAFSFHRQGVKELVIERNPI